MGVSKRIYTSQHMGRHVDISGMDQLLRNLNTTKDKIEKKATRAAIRGGMTPLMKAMRRAIGVTPTPSGPDGRKQANLTKAAKAAIGSSLKKKRGEYQGKVGFAVGKKLPKQMPDRAGRKGVGISARNIHWFVLGTKARRQPTKGPMGKRYVGHIEPLYRDVTDMAVAMSRNEVLEAWRKKYKQTLEREVNRLPK